jgi:hypothetical protein
MAGRRGRLRLAHSAGRRTVRTPCSNPFGLTPAELRREISRCLARGFQLWEIRKRLCPCTKDSETSE